MGQLDGQEIWVDLREVLQEIAVWEESNGVPLVTLVERIKELAHNGDIEAHLDTSA